jgi:hypothetical protein
MDSYTAYAGLAKDHDAAVAAFAQRERAELAAKMRAAKERNIRERNEKAALYARIKELKDKEAYQRIAIVAGGVGLLWFLFLRK